MTIGEKIKARREELGMTTEELGRLIGVQRSAVTKYEKDKVDLKSKQLQAIANALGVPSAALLGDDDHEDQQRLEALHQNPRLGLLFDRVLRMKPEDQETMIAVSASIMKELDGE